MGEDDAITQAREGGEIVKCLLLRCFKSKNVFAHVVPQKGDDEEHYCAKLAVADIEWLGHTKIILKTDTGRSVVALKHRVAKHLKEWKSLDNVQTESPAAYESQSNGGVEVGVKIVRGLFRTLKLCLEQRLGKYVPVSHALMPWLLEHTCILLNANSRGHDGLTSWERIKGRKFNQLLLGFGETVLWKLPAKGPRANLDGNMGTKWLEGIFLGSSRSSNTYTICTDDGITHARSIYRRPLENRWISDRTMSLTATPWSTRSQADATATFPDVPSEETPATRGVEAMPRQFRINNPDLEKYGFTDGCPQCEHIARYKKGKKGTTHTQICRTRILDAMMGTPEGRVRLEAFEERVDRALAERIEAADAPREERQPRPEPGPVRGGDRIEMKPEPAGPARAIEPRGASNNDDRPAGEEGSSTGLPEPAESAMDDQVAGDDGEADEDMGAVDEAESEEEKAIVHEDVDDEISTMLLAQLGQSGKTYRRELRTSYKHLVSEIYSPPRITKEIKRGR